MLSLVPYQFLPNTRAFWMRGSSQVNEKTQMATVEAGLHFSILPPYASFH